MNGTFWILILSRTLSPEVQGILVHPSVVYILALMIRDKKTQVSGGRMRRVVSGARPYPGTRKSEDPVEWKTDDKVLTTERP